MSADADVIGIDLGTTQSLVGVVDAGFPILLADGRGSRMTRSVVYYAKDGTVVVGEEAWRRRVTEGERTVGSIKRLMGRRASDEVLMPEGGQGMDGMGPEVRAGAEGLLGVVVDGVWRSPVEVSAAILRRLKAVAEEALERPVSRAVITVPAYFDDAQRQATKDAARLAGLNVLRLLNEPTAAAVAYGLDQQAEGVVAIYDLGGGTFDVSILRLSRGVFEVMATGGDSALGGDDFDHAIAGWIMTQAGLSTNLDPGTQRSLLQKACVAKELLSGSDEVAVTHGQWSGVLTRALFDELIEPMLARSLKSCRRAVRDAGIELADVEAVVMVGGSTRVPRVRAAVAELFGRPPLTDIDPDQVVAIGAATVTLLRLAALQFEWRLPTWKIED